MLIHCFLLDDFKEESIGVECSPRCGGCRCGNCPTGSKQMTIKEEREYEKFKALMQLDETGTDDDPGPYWRTSYPWTVDKNDLVDNKAAVLGVMNSTARKLEKDPSWRSIYESQLRDLVKRKFAREVAEDKRDNWVKCGGKLYYIAHQVNQHLSV